MRNWLDSLLVSRETDRIYCYVWHDGGNDCNKQPKDSQTGANNSEIRVFAHSGGASHRSISDYLRDAEKHLEKFHPEQWEEYRNGLAGKA